jgi:hypothetical protein
MPPCPYFGKPSTAQLILREPAEPNQCALIRERVAPCYLAADGLPADLDKCKFKGTGREIEMQALGCPDCQAARVEAYSDATTPGFFFTFCPRHKPA